MVDCLLTVSQLLRLCSFTNVEAYHD